jgi:protease I
MKPKALIMTANGFEDSELLYPYYRLQEAGFEVDIAAPKEGAVTGKHGYTVQAGFALDAVPSPASHGYDLLVLPGGMAPSHLRDVPEALDIARDFAASGKPTAAICHGPQVLAAAGLLAGRRATCSASVAEEITAVGARYEDSEVVVDAKLVTSRKPADLPAFMRAVMHLLGRPLG